MHLFYRKKASSYVTWGLETQTLVHCIEVSGWVHTTAFLYSGAKRAFNNNRTQFHATVSVEINCIL